MGIKKMSSEKMRIHCLEVTQVLKALAHQERLMVMCHLAEGEMNVSELLEVCDISQSQLSQFLGRLQREGLLEMRRESNFVYYNIKDKRIVKILKQLQNLYCVEE